MANLPYRPQTGSHLDRASGLQEPAKAQKPHPWRRSQLEYGYDRLNDEQFVGFSYSVLALLHFLARRLRKQALASLWFGVTRLGLVDYIPANPAEWFRWKSEKGVLNSHLVDEPQSWEVLRTHASNIPTDSLPQTLSARPSFLLWYVMVYPHRFTAATAKVIDDAVTNSSQ